MMLTDRLTLLTDAAETGGRTYLARLAHAPFPLDGSDFVAGRPFFDALSPVTGTREHTTTDGGRYSETAHYSSDRVLLHVPPQFSADRDATFVIFFHGELAEIRRSLVDDFRLPDQMNAVDGNVVLIAPQMALNARDSSPGKLAMPNGFARFVQEATEALAAVLDVSAASRFLTRARLVVAAYSAGGTAAAHVLDLGGLRHRIDGVLLFDALFGEAESLASWFISRRHAAFWAALCSPHCSKGTSVARSRMRQHGIRVSSALPDRLTAGAAVFHQISTAHAAIPRVGPPDAPLAALLQRAVDGMAR